MGEEADEVQLIDIDAVAYDGVCAFANTLNVSHEVWKIIVALVIPFVFVMTPFGVGIRNAYSILKTNSLVGDATV